MTDDPLLDRDQVGEQLHMDGESARRLMASGAIRSTRIGKRRLTRQSWLDAYVDSRADGGPGPRPVRRRVS